MYKYLPQALAASAVLALAAWSAPSDAQVGVSVNVGEPGFFGEINIGPERPPLVYAQPVVIARDPGYRGGPVYLHVPPGHEHDWAHHCEEYHACGRPVYFVRDDWYNREYVPRYRHDHPHDHDHDHEHDHERE